MTIDGRSPLGQKIDVNRPAPVDVGRLSERVGGIIANSMDEGWTRDDAVQGLVEDAVRYVGRESVIMLDGVLARYPRVGEAVDRLMATNESWTRGQAITQLLLEGAGVTLQETGGPFDFLKRHGWTQDADGTFIAPPGADDADNYAEQLRTRRRTQPSRPARPREK
jgi:hypothetical protein